MEIVVLVWLACGVFSAMVASSKGRGGCGWFLAGVLFGPLALLAVGFMAPIEVQMDPPLTTREDTRPCPFCAETIKQAAIKCRFCGTDITPALDRSSEQQATIERFSADARATFANERKPAPKQFWTSNLAVTIASLVVIASLMVVWAWTNLAEP
jgi:hypothetical protein